MPSVQMKGVPDGTHRVLRERAARAYQSLQEYLRSRLIADADQPTLEDVFDRIAARLSRASCLHCEIEAIDGA